MIAPSPAPTITLGGQRGGAEDAPPRGSRLAEVELRKMVDTRAGFWLLAAMALASVAAVALRLSVGSRSDKTFEQVFSLAELPVNWLLPVIGVLLMTGEWSQRTALTTFTLVPRRMRVIYAKADASVVLAVGGWLVALAVAAAGYGIASGLGGTAGGWDVSAVLLRQTLWAQGCAVLIGAAFGLCLRASAPAIVAYFAVPMLWGALTGLVSGLRGAADWLNTTTTLGTLQESSELTLRQWEQLGTSMLLWCALPMAIGLWRLHRQDIS